MDPCLDENLEIEKKWWVNTTQEALDFLASHPEHLKMYNIWKTSIKDYRASAYRRKRHVAPHDENGMQRLISTGARCWLNRCALLLHCRVTFIQTRNMLTYVLRQITQRTDVILTQVPWLHHCWHRLLTATITAWTSSLPPTGSTQQSLTSFCLRIRTASTTKRPTKRCALTPTVSRCF